MNSNCFKHCALEGCIKDLKNTRGGAFCEEHEIEYGNKCRIRECTRERVDNTLACRPHQAEWRKYKLDHSRASLLGVKRMIQRPEERNDWQPGLRRTVQHHDDDEDVIIPHHNYFRAARFYCVETITAPSAVLIAWVKFDKSESPTNILNLFEKMYPTEES